jgi:hypothetical protein
MGMGRERGRGRGRGRGVGSDGVTQTCYSELRAGTGRFRVMEGCVWRGRYAEVVTRRMGGSTDLPFSQETQC